jgi:hypothetical protein
VEAGTRLGYESRSEKSLSVLSKRFVVDTAWSKQGELKAIFEVERGFTWDAMHVLGHLVVLNAYAKNKGLVLPCVFVFDENLSSKNGFSLHTRRLVKNWEWYISVSQLENWLRLNTVPVYWNKQFELNTRSLTVDALLKAVTKALTSPAR